MARDKTGGRQKGTVNKDKQELIEMIQEKFPGYHPLIALAEIANDSESDKNLKLQASKEVCKYIVPQLKSVDNRHSISEGAKFSLIIE